MMKNWKRTARRTIVWAVAFCAGLYIADALMTTRTNADNHADHAATSRPALTLPAEVQTKLDRLAAARGPASFNGTLTINIDVAGLKDQRTTKFVGSLQDSQTFRHEATGDVLIVANAETVNVYDPNANQYLSTPRPTTQPSKPLTAQSDAALGIVLQQNPALYVAISGDLRELIASGDATPTVTLETPTDRSGIAVDHIRSVEEGVTRDLYLDRESGRLLGAAFDFSKLLEKQGATDVKSASITIDYDPAGAAPANDAQAYVFAPPANATLAKLPAPGELMTGGEPDSLVGKPAPTFTLKNLDDQEITFDGKAGEVVVLDFWATWCPPCRKGLPALAKTAEKFADRGLKVYAVNQQEDAATVRTFWKKEGFTMPALLDLDASVGRSYLVSGIPQTVVIGRDGAVKKVIVGFDPAAHHELDEAIEKALSESAR